MRTNLNTSLILFSLFCATWGTLIIKNVIPVARGCSGGQVCIWIGIFTVFLVQFSTIDFKYYNNETKEIRDDRLSFLQALCNSFTIFAIVGVFVSIVDTFEQVSEILLISSMFLFVLCGYISHKFELNPNNQTD